MVLFHTNRIFFSFSPLSPWKCVIFHRLELTHSMIHDWIIFCFNPIPTWVHCVTMVISGRMPVTNHTKTSFYVEYISLMLQFNVMCAQCVRSSYSLAQMHTLASQRRITISVWQKKKKPHQMLFVCIVYIRKRLQNYSFLLSQTKHDTFN